MCYGCVDYRIVRKMRESGENCTIAKVEGPYLKHFCFDEKKKQPNYKCANSEVHYRVEVVGDGEPVSYFSALCENDPQAYQACGVQVQGTSNFWGNEISSPGMVCGGYICNEKKEDFYKHIKCKYGCQQYNRHCNTQSHYTIETLCYDRCENFHCESESKCNGYNYGLTCYDNSNKEDIFILAMFICSDPFLSNFGLKCHENINCTELNNQTVSNCERLFLEKMIAQ